jgi:hypothetical protein
VSRPSAIESIEAKTRRERRLALRFFGPLLAVMVSAVPPSAGMPDQEIAISMSGSRAPIARRTLSLLTAELERRRLRVRTVNPSEARKSGELRLDFRVDPAISNHPEAFSVSKSEQQGARSLVIAGSDDTGLAYGIFEILGQIEFSSAPLFAAIANCNRSPAVRVRSVAMFLYNRELERDWYFSEEFWNRYFELLARSRLNQFTLIFGHQTSYLAPLFPFMIDVPGYERVKVPDYSAADRVQNLKALQRISVLAGEWGIRFILGIWQQHAHRYGRNLVEGLSYQDLFDYSPKALAILLKECPAIQGVQFRMNSESGIEEDDQDRFFTAMARATQSVGRQLWVDYRAKGLRSETVSSAQALGIRPVVSSKYWREHMGLPYHGTAIDPIDKERSYRRYGYWDLLYHDRPYQVLYRLWSLGSQKILLWGSLEYARRFALSSGLGDALGFEVCAPLSQKGFGNWPGGNWRIFAAPELEYYRWEFERYWAFYLTFGLAAYAPGEPQPVLEAEFAKRFGAAAPDMRAAYESASWIIPFVTATRTPSSSNFSFWPEMETGGLTDFYIRLGTGDSNRFYRVDEYVEDYLARRPSAKWSPERIASTLDRLAGETERALDRAKAVAPGGASDKEFAATVVDFGALGHLARYHARRLRSALDFAFFARTGERYLLLQAIEHYRKALEHWSALSRLTQPVYNPHLVFNRPPDQIGHWKDELPLLQQELERLEKIDRLFLTGATNIEEASARPAEPVRYRMRMKWNDENGTPVRSPDLTLIPDPSPGVPERYSMETPEAFLQGLTARLRYARILHLPVRNATAGRPIPIHASLFPARSKVPVVLYYRLAGTGFKFASVDMNQGETNVFTASLPAQVAGQRIFYYIRAADRTQFYHGSERVPHEITITDGGGAGPSIWHTDVKTAKVGAGLRIRARVDARLAPVIVRLHYRHLDQAEDWNVVEMAPSQNHEYEALIPGEFVVPGWDLMYAVEAIDAGGAGSFYPDFTQRQPFVVVPVQD